jgi:hypothetical protein
MQEDWLRSNQLDHLVYTVHQHGLTRDPTVLLNPFCS